MKKSFIIFCLLVSIDTVANNISHGYKKHFPSDTTVIPSILSINLNYYIGKPVDSLLSILPAGFTYRGFMPVGAGYAKGVYQSYSTNYTNNCFIEIFVDTFRFLPVPNLTPTTSWNMNLAKQETVAYIKVIKNNNVCVYGCNNPGYFH
jgi:hypothetical protein